MPRWYAPIFHMPMSSPIMTTMLGFFVCWAIAGAEAAIAAATHEANRPSLILRLKLMASPPYDCGVKDSSWTSVTLMNDGTLGPKRTIVHGCNECWVCIKGAAVQI